MEEQPKKPWQSVTLWSNLVMAGVAFFPSVSEFLVANPTILPTVMAGVNMLIRIFLTKKEVKLLK